MRAAIGLPGSGLSCSVCERCHRVAGAECALWAAHRHPDRGGDRRDRPGGADHRPALNACEPAAAARVASGTPARSRRPNADPRGQVTFRRSLTRSGDDPFPL